MRSTFAGGRGCAGADRRRPGVGLRAGTHNVPLIAGFATALELVQQERAAGPPMSNPCVITLSARCLEQIAESQLTGSADQRLPNHASFVFRDVDGNLLAIPAGRRRICLFVRLRVQDR